MVGGQNSRSEGPHSRNVLSSADDVKITLYRTQGVFVQCLHPGNARAGVLPRTVSKKELTCLGSCGTAADDKTTFSNASHHLSKRVARTTATVEGLTGGSSGGAAVGPSVNSSRGAGAEAPPRDSSGPVTTERRTGGASFWGEEGGGGGVGGGPRGRSSEGLVRGHSAGERTSGRHRVTMAERRGPSYEGDGKSGYVVGYSGYIPGFVYHYGQTFGKAAEDCISLFIRQQQLRGSRAEAEVRRSKSLPRLRSERSLSADMVDEFYRKYGVDGRSNPHYPPLPGYTGCIPLVRSTDMGTGRTYSAAARRGIQHALDLRRGRDIAISNISLHARDESL
ncbi:uncharacterized protein LOC143026010 [Oratosquilla oratoria]|uniref:uncharacterized protein LOC143026010 n=1 Tax=Oratosquilla oratoria TaxID=337810 RepID=UPI003F775D03